MSDTSPPFITLAAVCEQLGVSRSTANAWRRDGRFPKGKRLPNGHVRYAAADVEAFIDSLEAA
jgi:predicted DNA-binding transcriptional regulator AlpA